jgi:peptide/nickel transport system ATP-binding protein
LNAGAPLLEVDDLSIAFRGALGGELRAVSSLSFHVNPGETLAIVGESGCGKSVTAMSVLGLLPRETRITGAIRFGGRDILQFTTKELRALRGNEIGMVFQEPMTSLNPVFTVGRQIGETLRLHQGLDRRQAHQRAIELLADVGIPAPAQRVNEYPHQLSGGMRQRVMIAMALACGPQLLIADEPTTALDVTIQAQVLDLLRGLRERTGSAIVLITHDLGVVAEMADRVVVMYAGRKVEEAPVRQLFEQPAHPYTRGLLGALPRLGASAGRPVGSPRMALAEIPGQVPSLRTPITGCAFAGRCARAADRCREAAPPIVTLEAGHTVACHFHHEESLA